MVKCVVPERLDVLMGGVAYDLTAGADYVMVACLAVAGRYGVVDGVGCAVAKYADRVDVSEKHLAGSHGLSGLGD